MAIDRRLPSRLRVMSHPPSAMGLPPCTIELGRRACCAVLAGLTLAPWLMGCTRQAPKLQVASHTWPGYLPMFLARDEGWLSNASVELYKTASPSESMRLLASQQVGAAALTLDEVLRLRTAGVPLVVALVFNISSGADMVLGRGEVRQLADLRGRRIGVEITALGALMLVKTLEAAGLLIEEVDVVALPLDAQEAAWQAATIDALVCFEPLAGRLMRQGAHLLFDSRVLPNLILDVLAVRRDVLPASAAALRALLVGHFRALEHLHHQPLDAAYRLAVHLGGDGRQALDAYRGLILPDLALNRRLLGGSSPELLRAAREIAAAMAAHGLLPTAQIDLDDLARDDWLPSS